MANKKRFPIFTLAGIGILGIIMLIPLPATVVDILIALNLLILIIFFIIVHIKKPSVFSVLPTFLLVLTTFGLIVCIFSTRLVLVKGKALNDWLISPIASDSNDLMGIIRSFVFFILLIAFQLVICTQVLSRILELIARYSLNGLTIKRMMIETEYNSDAITKEEHERKKKELEQEADFYGPLDGAIKFILGDFKIRLFIIAVNIVGGILIDVLYRKEAIIDAVKTYISLSMSNALLTIFIPFLLMSMIANCIITPIAEFNVED